DPFGLPRLCPPFPCSLPCSLLLAPWPLPCSLLLAPCSAPKGLLSAEGGAVDPGGGDGGRGGMIRNAVLVAVKLRDQQFHAARAEEPRLQVEARARVGIAGDVQAAEPVRLRHPGAALGHPLQDLRAVTKHGV